jgi:PBP1b-binding outer membrane lipoprotein LpoB
MRKLIFIAVLALAGCASEAEKAEAEYRIVEANAIEGIDDADVCAAARKVEDAYLREGNAEKHKLWSLFASTDCS